MIYLDYAANTPVDQRVLDIFNDVTLRYFGNPNSMHEEGLKAKAEIDEASSLIAKIFKTEPKNIIYTSGSSESNNMIIKGIAERSKKKGKHIIISEVEHSSVLAPCNYLASLGYEISVLPLTKNGQVDLDILKKTIREDTILVSITAVDSELGTIQPIKEIADLVAAYPNCVFHTDATQAIGKVDIDYTGVDFLTFAPHKFFGLNGSGVLINFHDKKFIPLIHGGKSTTIYRSGTPVTAMCVASAKALELIISEKETNMKYIGELKKYVIDELSKIEGVHINSPTHSIVSTLNFSISNATKVVEELYKRGICVSRQSACSLGTAPSKSVMAITNDEELAKNSIRISMSKLTTKEELDIFLKTFKEIIYEDCKD